MQHGHVRQAENRVAGFVPGISTRSVVGVEVKTRCEESIGNAVTQLAQLS
jgi:hypothetical protein